ncbi:DsrE family protein [Geminocystis herdmanii]|uniref:DsrE family protein n=1 Tax=Geminocystis herdmanii TaxID=669359 RepID=UPI0003481931|nr:DsrE family protein [Geminocystis herdmanii]
MKIVSSLLLSSFIGISGILVTPNFSQAQTTHSQKQQTAVISPKTASLFVNLTTDDSWRGAMAIGFAEKVLQQGHPTTIFLNVSAVNLASQKLPQHTNGITGKTLQQMLQEFIAQGGSVLICPSCMKQGGISDNDLIQGVKMGSPQATQSLLFEDNVRVMSW